MLRNKKNKPMVSIVSVVGSNADGFYVYSPFLLPTSRSVAFSLVVEETEVGVRISDAILVGDLYALVVHDGS